MRWKACLSPGEPCCGFNHEKQRPSNSFSREVKESGQFQFNLRSINVMWKSFTEQEEEEKKKEKRI